MEEYEKAARYSDGKANDIDKGIDLVPIQVSKGDLKVVFKHSSISIR